MLPDDSAPEEYGHVPPFVTADGVMPIAQVVDVPAVVTLSVKVAFAGAVAAPMVMFALEYVAATDVVSAEVSALKPESTVPDAGFTKLPLMVKLKAPPVCVHPVASVTVTVWPLVESVLLLHAAPPVKPPACPTRLAVENVVVVGTVIPVAKVTFM